MVNALIRWSLENRFAVLALAALLTAAGVVTALRMPIDVFPDLTAPTVTVITEAPGMAPTEVESQVTFPVEAALNGAPGVRRVRSSTAVGISIVWVEFDWGTDILAARQVVSEKVSLAAADLPPESGRPVLAPISSILGEIRFLSLTSDRHSPIDLRTTADTMIRRRLLAVPGVAQVTPIGGEEKQYQVLLSPDRLRAHGISLEQVTGTLSDSNRNVSAGFLVERGTEYLVTGIGRVVSASDIASTMVASADGVPVRISELGEVKIGGAPKRGEASAMERPAVIIGIQKQPGANTLSLTRELDSVLDTLEDELGRIVERTIRSHPEVLSVARRTGRAELDEHAMGVESAEIDVSYRLGARSKAKFLEDLRRSLSVVPGVNFILGQPISHRIDHMLSGTRASVAVKIFGDDLYALRSLAERVRQAMSAVEGVVDLTVEQQMDVPVLEAKLDRAALGRHGISVGAASRTIEAAFKGLVVSRVLEGRNSFDLVVRLSGEAGRSPETLRDLPVDLPGGGKVPLGAVARVEKDFGPNTISRENVERKIVVMCNVAGRDVDSVVRDTRRAVQPILEREPGCRIEYGGQFEAAASANRILGYLGIAVVLGIGFLLHLAFASARDALLVMLNLPLALIGGIAGVFVSGGVLSVASLIGFITVFGIAARNGIMLISHIRYLQEREGFTDFREAVLRGALERVAPIVMTALAAGLALIPLALGSGKPGSEIQTPMAVVILFGLMSSMLLNMLVVPTLYLHLGRPVSRAPGGVR